MEDEDEELLIVDEGGDDLPSDLVIDEGGEDAAEGGEGADGPDGPDGVEEPAAPTSNLQHLIDNIYKYH